MHTNPVIIGLNIHEHRLPYLPRGMFAVRRFQFPLQGLEKRFGTGVIPTVPLPAKAISKAGMVVWMVSLSPLKAQPMTFRSKRSLSRRQVYPASQGTQRGDARHPFFPAPLSLKLTGKDVFADLKSVVRSGRGDDLPCPGKGTWTVHPASRDCCIHRWSMFSETAGNSPARHKARNMPY
jgi:hypothetical protein